MYKMFEVISYVDCKLVICYYSSWCSIEKMILLIGVEI